MARIKDGGPVKHAEVVKRENEAWELRAQGWTHQRIADKLNVHVSTVTKALQRAAEKHHDQFMKDIHSYKKHQVKIIEETAYNALEQYYKSQKKRTITTQQGKMVGGKLTGSVITTIQTVEQYGDTKLLSMFYKGMEDIRKIWGIDGRPTDDKEGQTSFHACTVDEKIKMFLSLSVDDRLRLLDAMITKRHEIEIPSGGEDEPDEK
ncbi:MAG: helix-turn-helix domain-containing protein [Patescibacteria group bacterium]|nr:helix-turn-helix domain-containing protein [Patescibacteria group bacterium]